MGEDHAKLRNPHGLNFAPGVVEERLVLTEPTRNKGFARAAAGRMLAAGSRLTCVWSGVELRLKGLSAASSLVEPVDGNPIVKEAAVLPGRKVITDVAPVREQPVARVPQATYALDMRELKRRFWSDDFSYRSRRGLVAIA